MADTKISGLTALTGANTASGDLLTIVDVSDTTMAATGTNKKITLTELQSAPVSGGTANGVLYLNGSKVATSGSALTFDGANLGVGMNPSGTLGTSMKLFVNGSSGGGIESFYNNLGGFALVPPSTGAGLIFYTFTGGVGSESYSEGMRLTSTSLYTASGINVGIGTSSPAYKLDVTSSAFTIGRFVRSGAGASAAIDIVEGSGGYVRLACSGGTSNMSFRPGGTELMLLASSGNLGLGVTPSAWTTYTAQQIRNASVYGWSGGNSFAALAANTWYGGSPAGYRYISTDFATEYYQYQGAHVWRTAASGTAGDAISFTQAMTLDASGNLLVGATTQRYTERFRVVGATVGAVIESASGYVTQYLRNDGFSGTRKFVSLLNSSSTECGSITYDGSTVAYNTTSDYRLKDNQQPLTGSGAFIDALQPKTWNWKADGSRGVGFIAHEVQEVSPGSVVGEKDGEQMQAMEYGSAEFIANIIAELQSLRKRLADAGIA